MGDDIDPFANPKDLFLRPFLFIVHSDADEDDRQLALRIATECESVCRPLCGTLDQLRQHSVFGRTFLGLTLVILSPAMLATPDRRAALVRQMRPAFYDTLFRHYCVCRGLPAESLRDYAEIAPLLDNVMAGDEMRSLPAILADLRDFVAHVMPEAPELSQPVASLVYGRGLRRTLGAFALGLAIIVGRAYVLARPAAILLVVAWWQEWDLPGTSGLVSFVAFFAGYRLNNLQGGDLWPWLGRRWQLPHHRSIRADNTPRLRVMTVGPVSIAGIILALRFDPASQWIAAAACVTLGVVAQAAVDYGNTRHLAAGLRIGTDAAVALGSAASPRSEQSRLDFKALISGVGGAIMTFYGGALMSVTASALLIAPAYLLAASRGSGDTVWLSIAAGAGYLWPGVLQGRIHDGIKYLGEYMGLSSTDDSLFKKLAGSPNRRLTIEKNVRAEEQPLVAAFAAAERALVMQWLNNIRIGLRPEAFRRWWPTRDAAFISYAWRDDADSGIADGVAAACTSAGVECFLDKVMLKSGEGVFRMPLAAGLSQSTHVFLVVTPGVASGQVVRREIEMAMGRWRAELLPAIICVVEPGVCEQLLANPAVPLPIRFLLTFCPQMTPAEAAQPALVRYVMALTRREGKWGDWRLLLSPSTAFAQVVRLPGIVPPD